MVVLIPLVKNDYWLALIYVLIIVLSFMIKYDRKDWLFFVLGFILMTAFEAFFIWAGSETFNRTTLFGIMPLWLPLAWGYGFVAIKRTVNIIE
jgi:hypothetical protein